jgi:hypothetical protein
MFNTGLTATYVDFGDGYLFNGSVMIYEFHRTVRLFKE